MHDGALFTVVNCRRKGVGRYAASILGTDLLLETVTPRGEKTTLLVEWINFESAIYLDDVEILIETILNQGLTPMLFRPYRGRGLPDDREHGA